MRYILGALFEYSVILLRMKIKTIRQIRKCLNGNLAAYLAPLANPLSSNVAVGNGINRQTQGTNPRNLNLNIISNLIYLNKNLHFFWFASEASFLMECSHVIFLHFDNLQTKWLKSLPIKGECFILQKLSRRNFFSSLRSYLKGWLGISVLFPVSVLDFFYCLCHCFLFLSEKRWMYKVNE